MSEDPSLSDSTVTAVIRAPIEKVNIADCLFTLPDAEYQRCSHAYIAAGTTTTGDGRPMSINVEMIGDALIVQHYVAEVQEQTVPLYACMIPAAASGRILELTGYSQTFDGKKFHFHQASQRKGARESPNLRWREIL